MADTPVVWGRMSRGEREELIGAILECIAEWRPLPRQLLEPLPPDFLRSLLDVVTQLKAEGLAGPHNRPRDRVKRLMVLMRDRGLLPSRMPTADDAVRSLPPETRREVLANEAISIGNAESAAAGAMSGQVAAADNPLAGGAI